MHVLNISPYKISEEHQHFKCMLKSQENIRQCQITVLSEVEFFEDWFLRYFVINLQKSPAGQDFRPDSWKNLARQHEWQASLPSNWCAMQEKAKHEYRRPLKIWIRYFGWQPNNYLIELILSLERIEQMCLKFGFSGIAFRRKEQSLHFVGYKIWGGVYYFHITVNQLFEGT